MRVLFVYDSLSPIGGGSQIAVLTWIKNLNLKNIKTKLITGNFTEKNEKNYFSNNINIIPTFSLNLSFLYPKFHLSLFLTSEAIKKINQFSPQIIHLNEPSILSFFILKFAQKNKIKTISSFHTNFSEAASNSSWLFSKNNGLVKQLIKKYQFYLLKKSNFITTPSNYYKNLLQEEISKKIFILPYPISNRFFIREKKISSTIPRIIKLVTFSRLSGEKKIDFLIEIMRYLPNDFQLTIIGDGVDRNFLEKKVDKLSLRKNIVFTGWIKHDNLPKILKKHHLFISASSFETFGISYIESLACGLPLVLLDYHVSREIIPPGMALFIKDLNPKKWAQELIKIKKRQKYISMKKQIFVNYQKIFKYNEIKSTEILINIYKKIINEKQNLGNYPSLQ